MCTAKNELRPGKGASRGALTRQGERGFGRHSCASSERRKAPLASGDQTMWRSNNATAGGIRGRPTAMQAR